MDNFTNRQVQFPNRVRLVPVAGQENVYELEDVPGDIAQDGEGTLLTVENFEDLGLLDD